MSQHEMHWPAGAVRSHLADVRDSISINASILLYNSHVPSKLAIFPHERNGLSKSILAILNGRLPLPGKTFTHLSSIPRFSLAFFAFSLFFFKAAHIYLYHIKWDSAEDVEKSSLPNAVHAEALLSVRVPQNRHR